MKNTNHGYHELHALSIKPSSATSNPRTNWAFATHQNKTEQDEASSASSPGRGPRNYRRCRCRPPRQLFQRPCLLATSTSITSPRRRNISGLCPIDLQSKHGALRGLDDGYIVTNHPRMTAFAPSCTSHATSCTAHCPGVCFRTLGLDVSTFEDDDVLLEITDTATQVKTSFTGQYDWPLNSDGSINMVEHTKTHRRRRFFAILPSGAVRRPDLLRTGKHTGLYR